MTIIKTVKVMAAVLLLTLTIGPALSLPTNAGTVSAKIQVGLPVLPPVWDMYKLKDKEAFQPTLDETSPLEGLTVALVHTEQTERSLRGFRGYGYVNEVNGNQAVILHDSISIAKDGNWTAQGLVRNETLYNIGSIVVTAELLSDANRVLETVSSQALVQNIRPGEPVPFRLDSAVPVSQVKEVKWSTRTGQEGAGRSREANLMVDYELEFGSETYKGHKRDDSPYPYVLATAFDNLGRAVKSAQLTVAWRDAAGSVVWIETAPLDDGFRNGVPENGAASFRNIVVRDPVIGPTFGKLRHTMWMMETE